MSEAKPGGNKSRRRKGGGGRGNSANDNKNNNSKNKEPKEPKTDSPAVQEEEEDVPDHHLCMVCYEPNLHLERGIAPCGHDGICSSCHLRLRSLLNDKRCPVCKASNEQIIVDFDPNPEVDEHKVFDDYEKWGDEIGPNYQYRDDVGMFFPVAYYHSKVVPLFSLKCNFKRCNFVAGDDSGRCKDANGGNDSGATSSGTIKALASHLATAHTPSLQICELCIEHKRDFVSRLPRFTANQLKEHNKYGDMGKNGSGSAAGNNNKGHPMCDFCKPKRFYDLTKLHEHLNKDHYECFVCKKLEKPLQFFKDYNKLNVHFDREHYLCHFPECLAARFVVFSNDIDLKAHERDFHGLVSGNGGSTKIQMEFRVRSSARDGSGVMLESQQVPNMEDDFGFGLDGDVFVPDSLDDAGEGQEREPDITHGPHAERTALLREQARARREELGINGATSEQESTEAFPTLGSQGAGNLVSWSREGSGRGNGTSAVRGRNRTQMSEENFPSLGGPSQSRQTSATSKLRASRRVATTSNSFSAMSIAANVPQTSSRPFARAANAPQGANFTSESFPSLGSASSSRSSGFTAAIRTNSRNNLSTDNFPSLGGAVGTSSGGNKYSAAQHFSKKKAAKSGMNLNVDQHFPAAAMIPEKKMKNVFQKKKTSSMIPAGDDFLSFPPPPMATSANSDAKEMVGGMKLVLGPAKYKNLKKLTKSLASNELDPETYVTSSAALFDGGIKDPSYWEFIPNLISTIPNQSHSKRALRYLETLKYSSDQVNSSKLSSNNRDKSATNGGWSASSNSAAFASAPVSAAQGRQYNSAAAIGGYAARAGASSVQGLSTGYSGRSAPVPQSKMKKSWGEAGSNNAAKVASSRPGSVGVAASHHTSSGSATKFMAKEISKEKKVKQAESVSKQGTNQKKKKAKNKKNALQDLAFL